jgi:hypothetical protein
MANAVERHESPEFFLLKELSGTRVRSLKGETVEVGCALLALLVSISSTATMRV